MSDVTSNVGIKVTADGSNAVAEAKKIADATSKIGDGAKKGAGGFSEAIGSIAKGLGTFNFAIEGAKKLVDAWSDAWKNAKQVASNDALERNLPSGAFEKFSKALDGQVAKTDALRIANKALHGDFKITADQLAHLGQAAERAEREGLGPAKDNLEKMLEAVQEKGLQKLDDFGIALKGTGNHAKDTATAIAALDSRFADTEPLDERSRRLRDAGKVWDELGEKLKVFGAVAVEQIMDIANAIVDHFNMSGEVRQRAHWVQLPDGRMARSDSAEGRAEERFGAARRQRLAVNTGRLDKAYDGDFGGLLGLGAPETKAGRRGGGRGGYTVDGEVVFDSSNQTGQGLPALPPSMRDRLSDTYVPWSSADQYLGSSRGAHDPLAGIGSRAGDISAFGDLSGAGGSKFGSGYDKNNPLSSFLQEVTDQSQLAGGALGAFASGATAAMTAAIDGSEGVAAAFRKATAAALKAKAVEWGVMALGEAAYAVGSLAMGDVRGAGTHGLAALKFAAAAAAAGVGASIVGGGGGGAPSGGGGSAGLAGGGFATPSAGGGGGPMNVTINLGDGFVGSPREVGEAVAGALRDGMRSGARTTFTTRLQKG